MNYPSLSMHVRGSSLLDNRSLRALRMKATTIRHMTKKTIMYMHQASKPLHFTLQTPWRLFRDSTMRGLHLAKPQGTNTTPFPKKLPQCRQLRGPGQWSWPTSSERAQSALSVGPPPRPKKPLPQRLTAVLRRSRRFFRAVWRRGR